MAVISPTKIIPFQKMSGGTKYEPIPEGSYQGILSRVQYFGTHTQIDKKTGDKYEQLKIVLVFEIDYKADGQDKNRLISTGYPLTYSLSKKATLTTLLKSWLGTKMPPEDTDVGLDFDAMFNMPVMVGVTHEVRKNRDGVDTTYDKISSLSMPPRGMMPVEWTQDQFMWSIVDDLDLKIAEELKMPNFLIEFAKNSKEYREHRNAIEGKQLDDAVMAMAESGGAKRATPVPQQGGDDEDIIF